MEEDEENFSDHININVLVAVLRVVDLNFFLSYRQRYDTCGDKRNDRYIEKETHLDGEVSVVFLRANDSTCWI